MSRSQYSFSQVPVVDIPRSRFDRSHGVKTTMNEGYLYPIFIDEVLPGDTFNLNTTVFARMATPIKPIMDNLYFDIHYFFVPNRLVWTNFVKMMGEQDNPGDSTDYIVPILNLDTSIDQGSLGDYFGLPTHTGALNIEINALPFRAYNRIWNEWYRDQNLQNSVQLNLGDGPDDVSTYGLLKRGKRHDYFTSALPWPQKGPAVTIPLGTTAPVTRVSSAPAWSIYEAGNDTLAVNQQLSITSGNLTGTTDGIKSMDPNGGLVVNLESATSATINSLRQAFQLQRLYERDARGGTRYIESIKSHFGVVNPDFRLQRSEFLGSSSTPVGVSTIAQTSATDTTSPQGNLAAMATVHARGAGFVKSFTEHGYVLGLASIRADLNYQQGLNRMWSRRERFDFYYPALSHLGEQAVLNKEIYCQGDPALDDGVFGYQERFAEYRYKPSIITGAFRSSYEGGSLDYWHLAQDFDTLPLLNDEFIKEAPPVSRVIAVPSEPHFLVDVHHRFITARPMPMYSVPGLIDHL